MAIQLEANYSKKIGLPGYSSHQFSITLKTELNDISQIDAESSRLYGLLQSSVDRELQQQGYVPVNGSGHSSKSPQNGNGHHQNGHARSNGSHQNTHPRQLPRNNTLRNPVLQEEWKCSPKQKELILKVIQEQGLDKRHVEQLSQQLFGLGVKALNKLQASGLIDELISQAEESKAAAGGGR